MKTTFLILDDEPIARKVLKAHLEQVPNFRLGAEFANPLEAYQYLREEAVDLLFLDIQMPGLTGLDLLRSLKNPPAVIITTAHRDHAVESFDLDVIDYLLKPVSLDRLLKALDRYHSRAQPGLSAKANMIEISQQHYLDLRADRKTVRIPVDKILYLESLKDYVRVHTDDEVIVTRQVLSDLENLLPASKFVRIHRSFLVAKGRIRAYSAEIVEVATVELPISRSFKASVLAALQAI